ncbi:MAG TPA: hypothetical protein ENN29_03755 [Candidatus Hydrogenedentes bacterium]|nr:hypothetical protein [Candidatus Hydrogenedentota bacterium]
MSQQRDGDGQLDCIEVKRGVLTLKTIQLEASGGDTPRITLEPSRRHSVVMNERRCVITLSRAITLQAGQALRITLRQGV